jgi:hypothetical protein
MLPFTPISLSNHSSTPLSIFPLIAPIPVIITLFVLSFFSLCSIFSYIIFILFIQSAFSNCPFSSLPLISSLTVANSFLSSPFSSRPEKGSAFHPLIISRLAVNGIERLARWVHVKQGSSWIISPGCVRFLFQIVEFSFCRLYHFVKLC